MNEAPTATFDQERAAYIRCGEQFRSTRKHLPDCPTLVKRRATIAAKAERLKRELPPIDAPSFGCFTGDCPHGTQAECDAAIRAEFAKLERDHQAITDIAEDFTTLAYTDLPRAVDIMASMIRSAP